MRSGALAVGALALAAGLGQAGARSSWAVPGSYLVVRGDSLWTIAQRVGISVPALAAANGITDANFVEAGTTLVIPATSAAGPSAGVPGSPAATGGDGDGDGDDPVTSPGGAPAAASSGLSLAATLPAGLQDQPSRLGLLAAFQEAAGAAGVPASLLEAIAWQESGWQAGVVSSAGALGVGQLTPDTVAFVNSQLVGAPLDPSVAGENIAISARFLRYLLDQTGDPRLAVAAYYQGLASVQADGILPESQQYVADVLALQSQF